MRPVVYTLSDASGGAKTSSVYPPDNYVSPFNVAISVVVTGTVNYTVQYTFDDPIHADEHILNQGLGQTMFQ